MENAKSSNSGEFELFGNQIELKDRLVRPEVLLEVEDRLFDLFTF